MNEMVGFEEVGMFGMELGRKMRGRYGELLFYEIVLLMIRYLFHFFHFCRLPCKW